MDRFRAASDFRLSNYHPANTHGLNETECEEILRRNQVRIAELQNVLYAEDKQSLLILLASMDTGGKDPIIRDVLQAANPQACRVTAFKKASKAEEKHDRFWRFHQAMPAAGEIGVFNRSYYDELIYRKAHGELDDQSAETEYSHIRNFEAMLSDNHTRIIKVFLHVTKEEQKQRLQERMDDPHRHWELSEADFRERDYWDGYMAGFEQAIRLTNTERSAWYLIPAEQKWFRDAAASIIISEALARMKPEFPPASMDLSKVELR